MQEICVERYVERNRDRWRVGCAGCGILVDNLDRYGAEQLRKLLASSTCGAAEEAAESSQEGSDLDVSA